MPMVNESQTIVFFDGMCVFCNARIDFLLRHDKRKRLHFAPLQGETAKRMLPPELVRDLSTITVAKKGVLYTKSTAILQVLLSIGGVWAGVGRILLCVPQAFRDWGYDFVADRRYRWFGKRDQCRMPAPEERERFLP